MHQCQSDADMYTSQIEKIDSHHLLNFDEFAYSPSHPKSLAVKKLGSLASGLDSIEKIVLVQESQDSDATMRLLAMAECNDSIQGVVGWLDFESVTATFELTQLANSNKFKGLSLNLERKLSTRWLLKKEFDCIYKHLINKSLCLDVFADSIHLASIERLAKQYPDLKIVINRSRSSYKDDSAWVKGLVRFRHLFNVAIKLSGVPQINEKQRSPYLYLTNYFSLLVNLFGIDRMLWGNDQAALHGDIQDANWLGLCEKLDKDLTVRERSLFWSINAMIFYNLDVKAKNELIF